MKKYFVSALFISLIFICLNLVLLCGCKKRNLDTQNYTVTYSADEGGSISGMSTQTIKCGEASEEVVAIPNTGYQFVKWSDGINTAERTDKNVTSNISVTAKFEKLRYAVKYETDGNGNIVGAESQSVSYGESALTITAVPNTGYKFEKWSDGVDTAERTDRNVTEDISVTALFDKLRYAVKYETDGSGYIVGNENQSVEYGDNAAIVTAIPNTGYQFVKWSDGINTAERTDKNVTSNISVTAKFEKLRYAVKYETDGNGYIVGKENQNIEYGDNGTKVTAITNTGYQFVKWSDGVDTAERTDKDITADKTVTAIFEKQKFKVSYVTDGNGYIVGNENQSVEYGDNAAEVTVIPYTGYQFVKWSDGVLTIDRQEINIKENIQVTALFGYSVEYKVDGGRGGKIIGDTFQTAIPNDSYNEVTAVAYDGYVFTGWSDMLLEAGRIDVSKTCREYIAYFEPIEKTFRYDCGTSNNLNNSKFITLKRNELQDIHFDIPMRDGYIFCGWYTDKNFTTKIADEKGNLMLGYYAFDLDADTIYAKWKNVGDDTIVHKIMIVMVDEIHASLFSTVSKNIEYVNYKMSSIERKILALLPNNVSEYLNSCFDGQIVFEVDTYFTTVSIDNNCFKSGRSYDGNTEYSLDAKEVPELWKFINLYHNFLTTFGMNDYLNALHNASGVASIKNGNVYIEGIFLPYVLGDYYPVDQWVPLQNVYEDFIAGKRAKELDYILSTYIHEFAHTVESYYSLNEIYEYHSALDCGGTLEITKKYLTKKLEIDGQFVGVPQEYWLHDNCFNVLYESRTIEKSNGGGKIARLGSESRDNYISLNLHYGSDIEVEAIPDAGYKFLMWSDGITTAIRRDTNIISSFSVNAIFVRIEGITVHYSSSAYFGVGGKINRLDGGEVNNEYEFRLTAFIRFGGDIEVEAIPYEGYKFLMWSDGVTTARRHDENITNFISVEAIFIKEN